MRTCRLWVPSRQPSCLESLIDFERTHAVGANKVTELIKILVSARCLIVYSSFGANVAVESAWRQVGDEKENRKVLNNNRTRGARKDSTRRIEKDTPLPHHVQSSVIVPAPALAKPAKVQNVSSTSEFKGYENLRIRLVEDSKTSQPAKVSVKPVAEDFPPLGTLAVDTKPVASKCMENGPRLGEGTPRESITSAADAAVPAISPVPLIDEQVSLGSATVDVVARDRKTEEKAKEKAGREAFERNTDVSNNVTIHVADTVWMIDQVREQQDDFFEIVTADADSGHRMNPVEKLDRILQNCRTKNAGSYHTKATHDTGESAAVTQILDQVREQLDILIDIVTADTDSGRQVKHMEELDNVLQNYMTFMSMFRFPMAWMNHAPGNEGAG